jgi:hypothetical protein
MLLSGLLWLAIVALPAVHPLLRADPKSWLASAVRLRRAQPSWRRPG